MSGLTVIADGIAIRPGHAQKRKDGAQVKLDANQRRRVEASQLAEFDEDRPHQGVNHLPDTDAQISMSLVFPNRF